MPLNRPQSTVIVSCKKVWLHFNGQLSHYCSPSFCKSPIKLFPFKYYSHVFMICICCDGGGGRHWQDPLLWLCRCSKGLSQLQREFCVLSERRKRERDSKPELWSLLTESISPASPRLFLPGSHHSQPIEISHSADDGSTLKDPTGGILAKSCWSERQDLTPASGHPLRKATYFGANHSSSEIDRPRLPSSASHIRISLCSSYQGCERRLLNATAHIIDEARKKL